MSDTKTAASTNGKSETKEQPVNRIAPPVSKFRRLVGIANELGTKKQTAIRSKTEEGQVTLTVSGQLCTDGGALLNQAAMEGGKVAMKAESGFGEASGSGSASVDGRGAQILAAEMMNVKEVKN